MPESMKERTIAAGWVFPVVGPPLRNGCVRIAAGRITAVSPAGECAPDECFPDHFLLPGFVNAHCHLDLEPLSEPPGSDFPGWLQRVIASRRGIREPEFDLRMLDKLAAVKRCGTTTLGDISVGGRSGAALQNEALRGVVFTEILGLPKANAARAWAGLLTTLRSRAATPNCRWGISPHAPYSVRRSLFHAADRLAENLGLPLAIHLAESAAEMQLLAERTGPFVEFLRSLGVWEPDGLIADPHELLTGQARTLFIHANYLEPCRLTDRQSIVHCPRTHAAFGHPPFPLREWLASGTCTALGTDSLASNPDLDILAEACFVRRQHPSVSSADLLRMLTLYGARALGLEAETGSLEPGKSADAVLLPAKSSASCDDPHELLFRELPPVNDRLRLFRGDWMRD